MVGEFLVDLKKEFGGGDDKTIKVAELKKIEQKNRKMEKFVQEFRKIARESGYKGRSLVEKFKREMNKVIKRKLMEVERPPMSIEQWYERAVNLDRHLRESRQEEKRLRDRREIEAQAPKLNTPENTNERQEQKLPQSQVWPRR